MKAFDRLASEVRACRHCEIDLPEGPRPVLQIDPRAKILIAGQAPGRRVHASGVPFDDRSGVRLREWLGVDDRTFYDPCQVALLPMGFCYPGSGKSGDLPPRTECADLWRERLLAQLKNVEMTLLIGSYAIKWHLPEHKGNLTEAVADWRRHAPRLFVAPHPSPRNQLWLRRNPWFEQELLPELRGAVAQCAGPTGIDS